MAASSASMRASVTDHIKACAGSARSTCLSIGIFFRQHHPAQCIVLYLLRVMVFAQSTAFFAYLGNSSYQGMQMAAPIQPARAKNDRGRKDSRLPALRTVRAIFPHTALQLAVASSGLACRRIGFFQGEQPTLSKVSVFPSK